MTTLTLNIYYEKLPKNIPWKATESFLARTALGLVFAPYSLSGAIAGGAISAVACIIVALSRPIFAHYLADCLSNWQDITVEGFTVMSLSKIIDWGSYGVGWVMDLTLFTPFVQNTLQLSLIPIESLQKWAIVSIARTAMWTLLNCAEDASNKSAQIYI